MERPQIVELEWIDVQSVDVALIFPEEIDFEPQKAFIVGYLVKETKENYFVAKEFWQTGQCKYLHIIPKKYVSNQRRLK